MSNVTQDNYLQEIDKKINSYKNQIDKLKCEISSIKRENIDYQSNIYQNPINQSKYNNYNNNYSSINRCQNQNPCPQNLDPCYQIETSSLRNENAKLKGLVCCYEEQIKSFNEKICKLEHLLTNKDYEMNECISQHKKKMEEELKRQHQIISQELCNEKIQMNEKLCQQKQEFERILSCRLREKEIEFEKLKQDCEREICIRENKLNEFNNGNEINKIKNDFECQLKQIQCEINNKDIEIGKLNEKLENNLKIISDLFCFFHQNVNLFNNTGVINCDAEDIKYDENNQNKNLKCSSFIFTTLNNFICKILKDNKEMYELLLNYKNIIAKNEEENEQILNQNNCLKGQLCDLFNQLSKKSQNQSFNKETNDITNFDLNLIEYDGPIKHLKSRINELEKTIKEQENE